MKRIAMNTFSHFAWLVIIICSGISNTKYESKTANPNRKQIKGKHIEIRKYILLG